MTDVDISVRIAARPDTVFRFLTDPDRMRAWMGEPVEVDPRPGGVYRVSVIDGNVAIGEYVEVVADERVVWTWGWEGSATIPPGSSVVEVTLTPDGDGTLLRLRHSGLPDEEAVNDHGRGWAHYTARLALAAAGVDPGPDTGPAP
jgi:uncharacterized protein YndB with AHSA1/START domain